MSAKVAGDSVRVFIGDDGSAFRCTVSEVPYALIADDAAFSAWAQLLRHELFDHHVAVRVIHRPNPPAPDPDE